MSFPKRGGAARDRRTGSYVRVAEEGMGGGTWMVRPVYKSDGYWVETKDLDHAADPHDWKAREGWLILLVLVVQAWLSWGMWTTSAGDPVDRVWLVVLASCTTMNLLLRWTRLYRP